MVRITVDGHRTPNPTIKLVPICRVTAPPRPDCATDRKGVTHCQLVITH